MDARVKPGHDEEWQVGNAKYQVANLDVWGIDLTCLTSIDPCRLAILVI